MPTEVYLFGINMIYIPLTLSIMGLFVHHVIIPVFYELQIVSTYEVLACSASESEHDTWLLGLTVSDVMEQFVWKFGKLPIIRMNFQRPEHSSKQRWQRQIN